MVAVIGDGVLSGNSAKAQFAYELGSALVTCGYRICCGGLGGAMEETARGAHASPAYREGDVVGILPGCSPSAANAYIDIAVCTGLDHARNFIVANSDAVVAIGGGSGTLSELSFAWIMKRLIMAYRVPDTDMGSDVFSDWSALVAGRRLDDKIRYPDIPDDRIYGVDTAADVIRCLAENLARYSCRPERAGQR
jgi:uncharacterized protein (TIGR00725 family)